jgi:hypothetical protein
MEAVKKSRHAGATGPESTLVPKTVITDFENWPIFYSLSLKELSAACGILWF